MDICEFCGVEIGLRNEHPCYAVLEASEAKPTIKSIALLLNGYPGYGLIIPDGSGYATAVNFIMAIVQNWPIKHFMRHLWPAFALLLAIGSVVGGILVYLAFQV